VNIKEKIKNANELAKLGKINEAFKLLEPILTKFPKQPEANAVMGIICLVKNELIEAENYFKLSLSSCFDKYVAQNLSVLLVQQKRWKDAFPWSQKLIINSNELSLMSNHALILRNIGQMDEALLIYENLLEKYPENINVYISYGFTLNLLERFNDAIKIYLRGLSIKDDEFGLLYNLGITYLNQFDYTNSLKYLLLALNQNNQSIDLLLTVAVCYAKKRDFDAAFNSVNKAKKLQPNNPLISFQMGTLYLQQDKNDLAVNCFNQAINIDPSHVEANYHKGLAYLKEEKYTDAIKYYRYRVIRKNNKFGIFNDFEIPIINNQSELLISWEQGIGDEILSLSLMNQIKKKVKSITYITQDKLYDWLKLNLEGISIIKDSESQEYIQKNSGKLQINIVTLMAFVDDWDNFFKTHTNWQVSIDLHKKYKKKYKLNNEKILGISWKSANKKIGDEKSIPLNDMLPILKKNKIISLQYGDVKDELKQINLQEKINIFYDQELDYYNDINSLAALISICDEVVTCSNVTAHIAGRLGIKTHLMIPKAIGNIWYWNTQSNYSKWYPSVKIHRQQTDGDWCHLIEKIKLEVLN